MIFQHSRFQIWNINQHPYRHSLDEFLYSNDALPGVKTVGNALNYLVAVLYPQSKPAVDTKALLPALGNSINDMRVVHDDGDGKAAAYRWEQREGDAAPLWYKIYDLDWGTDSILQQFQLKTQDLYVKSLGYDDLDATGQPVSGLFSGQKIFGGKSADSNLSLFANSGDGTGPSSGYVQVVDHLRPAIDSVFSCGTDLERWQKGWFDELTTATMTLGEGSIIDTTGSIDFGASSLSTTGSITSDTLTISSGSIIDTTGSIDFGASTLRTTSSIFASNIIANSVASSLAAFTQIGSFTLGNGTISSTTPAIGFGALDLVTTGVASLGSALVGALSIANDTIAATAEDGDVVLSPDGLGAIVLNGNTSISNFDIDVADGDIAVTNGKILVNGLDAHVSVDNVKIDGNSVFVTDDNGSLVLSANGTGVVDVTHDVVPSFDGTLSLGGSGLEWGTLWLSGGVSSGTQSMEIGDLLRLRNANFRDGARLNPAQAGDALFYDGSQWIASAPDTEIDHGTISGLDQDDHTQYAKVDGRTGGQEIVGGTGALENLDLESTTDASKGYVQTKSTLRPFENSVFSGTWAGLDLGSSDRRFRHVYSAGEAIGLRLENLAVNPAPAVANRGRLVFNTVSGDVYVDTGIELKRISPNRFEQDTVWNGTDLTKDVTVSDVDATKAIWQLKNNSDDFEVIYCSLKATSATNLRITVGSPLPAGSYRLVGVE